MCVRVMCLGDSNTYGYDPCSDWGGCYPDGCCWVDLLAESTGWEVINAGENGRGIPVREYELRQFDQMPSVDLLIIMLGTNDLLMGADVDTVTARMEAFLTRVALEKEKIWVIAPPPVRSGTWVTEESTVSASRQLAGCYQKLARRLGVCFADAGRWHIALAFDGVHFTEAGHKAFAAGLGGELVRHQGRGIAKINQSKLKPE